MGTRASVVASPFYGRHLGEAKLMGWSVGVRMKQMSKGYSTQRVRLREKASPTSPIFGTPNTISCLPGSSIGQLYPDRRYAVHRAVTLQRQPFAARSPSFIISSSSRTSLCFFLHRISISATQRSHDKLDILHLNWPRSDNAALGICAGQTIGSSWSVVKTSTVSIWDAFSRNLRAAS